jgi:subtilisin family serine protease
VSYQVEISDTDAAIVRANPLIAFAEPITEDDGEALVIPRDDTPSLHKRALPPSLNQRDKSEWHLGLISARNQKKDPTKLPNYVFEPLLGRGQTIYVIDSGYRKTHTDFDASEREVRDYTVPNSLTLGGIRPSLPESFWGPEDMSDISGHGTQVASIAAGYTHGVASLANLVVVKFRNWARNPLNPGSDRLVARGVMDGALEDAFKFVFGDVARQRKKSNDPTQKYIINLSYGK